MHLGFSTMLSLEPLLSISELEYLLPDANEASPRPNGGRRNTVAAAKREAIKDRRRKAHKRACR